MNWGSWLVWGFGSTIVLTTIFAVAQGLGMTRMSIPYILGSIVTRDRDRAKMLGIGMHVLVGWAFSLIYVLAFEAWGAASWWRGALIGLAHSAFVLGVLMPALPGIHPSMASERRGPTVVRQLEPPGFFGLHYGIQTPISVVAAHVVFGIILGSLYQT
jgi:uncharacterized membrane protein YagU involved in acid resistance